MEVQRGRGAVQVCWQILDWLTSLLGVSAFFRIFPEQSLRGGNGRKSSANFTTFVCGQNPWSTNILNIWNVYIAARLMLATPKVTTEAARAIYHSYDPWRNNGYPARTRSVKRHARDKRQGHHQPSGQGECPC